MALTWVKILTQRNFHTPPSGYAPNMETMYSLVERDCYYYQHTGVPRSEGTPPSQKPCSRTIPRFLWCSYGGGAVSYERGTPVAAMYAPPPRLCLSRVNSGIGVNSGVKVNSGIKVNTVMMPAWVSHLSLLHQSSEAAYLIAASMYDTYSVRLSIRPMCTR